MALSLEQLRAKAQLAPAPSAGQGLQLDPQGRLPVSLLRINGITGAFDNNGVVLLGTGFTVNHAAAGHYVVTFTNPLLQTPVTVATPSPPTGNVFAVISTAGPTGVTILTLSVTNVPAFTDTGVSFLAVASQ